MLLREAARGAADVLVTSDWLNNAPLFWLGVVLFAAMIAAASIGRYLRMRTSATETKDDKHEGYIVSAVLGLLALLTGFTFSLAVERFETRRELVLQQANALGTAYLRAQLLPAPHRARLSGVLVEYTDNAIVLANAGPLRSAPLLAKDDEILTRLWASTAAAYDDIRTLPFSVPFVTAINAVIDMDGARRAARMAHVPTEVFAVLLIYLVGTAGVLGYVLTERRGRLAAGFLLVLLTLSQILIIDIDRPTTGGIREHQGPMENLRDSLARQPPAVFDRWRSGP